MKAVDEIFLAGGCLWGVQEFVRHLPGVLATEAGRANGVSASLNGPFDGYAECVRVTFDPAHVSVVQLIAYLFEIIDPYSLNQQGPDIGPQYRTGVYSRDPAHLEAAGQFIEAREDASKIALEIAPLTHYLKSAPEHQDRLSRCPDDSCHLPRELLHKYRNTQ
ncbi:MAG: Peptide methionine sulfoxide reductase MsrA/MsrB 1 [Opitutia bacterium UBA7350]|nr:MAG: Peptide methionine sulfoxide reductase MsrA/MsrB 1 [Opitutae bacterium UBA7350]